MGFIADVDVNGLLRELCEMHLAEPEPEVEEFDFILGLDDSEVRCLSDMLTRKEGVDGPRAFELRARVVEELNAYMEDTDIPF